jgi:hypothetical protein
LSRANIKIKLSFGCSQPKWLPDGVSPFFHEYKFRARISPPPANVVRAVNTPEKSLFCEWRNLNKYDNEADFSHTKRSIRFAFLVMLRTNQAPSQVQKRFSFFMF